MTTIGTVEKLLAEVIRQDVFTAHAPRGAAHVFWIDDVWLTGYVAGSLNIPRLSLNSYFTVYR